MAETRFHLAFPVADLEAAARFYVEGLGCEPGRRSAHSLILNLGGHQIVAQLTLEELKPQKGIYPRHFGLIFENEEDWRALVGRCREKNLPFYQEPKVRFEGTPVEHRTFFLEDPFHNLLEFKHYRFASAIFGETAIHEVGDRK
ncbi:MAG: VOC family protein [bacterium]